jgi:type II secretory pathway pseudopilin PulG
MSSTKKKTPAGFTLIETLVYLALFALIMVGLIGSAYNIFEGNNRTQTKTTLQEEGDFLLAKINWVLIGLNPVNGIVGPVLGGSGLTLEVNKTDPLIINPVCLTLTSGKVQIKKDGSICSITSGYIDLNNSNTTVSALSFDHQGSASGPEWVAASFTLNTKTPEGHTYSQDFTTTKYLRK